MNKEIDQYIESSPAEFQPILRTFRTNILELLPGVEEMISYRIPTFKYKGKRLFAFATFPSHCSFITMSKVVPEELKSELEGYKRSGTTIYFDHEKEITKDLLDKIIKIRFREVGL